MYITFPSRHCLAKGLHKCRTWSVSKMKTPYDICFLALIQIMYQKDKFCYFSNKNVIFIMTMD